MKVQAGLKRRGNVGKATSLHLQQVGDMFLVRVETGACEASAFGDEAESLATCLEHLAGALRTLPPVYRWSLGEKTEEVLSIKKSGVDFDRAEKELGRTAKVRRGKGRGDKAMVKRAKKKRDRPWGEEDR